jgi:ATP-dependent DNA helicase RecG
MAEKMQKKLVELIKLPTETEWVEFKVNNENPTKMGENVSALANGAALHGKPFAYLVWGIEDGSHKILGTQFKPRKTKIGNEDLESWLLHLLNPRIHFTIHEFLHEGLPIVLWEIPATRGIPLRFKSEAYIRVGSSTKKLKDTGEKEAKLYQVLGASKEDWSAKVVEGATIQDLDPKAIEFARQQFREKNPNQAEQIPTWDDITFLNKAKVFLAGKVTHTALLLLGNEESTHFLSPSQARITWVLRDEKTMEKDYQHFDPPFILASAKVVSKIRNLTVRHLPSGTLFPIEATQYDAWVMREMIHNCIAHQDYGLAGRITVVENPDSLLFTNLGSFIPGTVEEMIRSDSPPEIYRNPFLAQAMVSLNMIETFGSGIKRMFMLQRERNFPMPDYKLDKPDKVSVKLTGQLLDENYTQLLLSNMELDLLDVIALDKVQKKLPLDDASFLRLKSQKLIDGRRPNIFVSAKVAAVTGDKATYIKNRAFNKSYYQAMIVSYLEKYGTATRKDFDDLLLNKLSDTLNIRQKHHFLKNLLQDLRRESILTTDGGTRGTKWRLSKTNSETPG